MSNPWTIRAFDPDHDVPSLLKLYRDAASYDASLESPTDSELRSVLAHPMGRHGEGWVVAAAQNGAMVGALEVRFVGTLRTELKLAVNPAWRGRGVGGDLLARAPAGRRLLITTRASVSSASSLVDRHGFVERYRTVRLRRSAQAGPLPTPKAPTWARIKEDPAREPIRYIRAAKVVFGDDEIDDPAFVAAMLQRPGMRVFYLVTPKGDDGICLTGPSNQLKKSELGPEGEATVGVVYRVALSKQARGKGVSRPLVVHGINRLIKDGYDDVEALADRRRQAAVDLYLRDGFEVVDEDIHWIKREAEG